ncbi:OVARIAN TUMOR DOMAIN-containing deubiquitinating enzyme 4-like [Tripterygium wilfordii]|uniref:OVARIAN TUMOR DOMAIN-containing deubiquitinating enzyme 4-like n=1 Tax=Tripterygium wilfordii TaxID=458696 RepID=UPI0018F805E8|nr:OVARIAN TUMOR DOMAIN-containing deubiquitinating enzyme 4-like [Tripterygium wilfordii]
MIPASMSVCVKNVGGLSGCIQRQMGRSVRGVVSQGQPTPSCFCHNTGHSKTSNVSFSVTRRLSRSSVVSFQTSQGSCFQLGIRQQRGNSCSLALKDSVNAEGSVKHLLEISSPRHSMSMRFLLPTQRVFSKIKCDVGPISRKRGCASAGFAFSMLACYSSYKPIYAEADGGKEDREDGCDLSYVKSSHGKRVYTDYRVIGVPGDGRCLFRSLAHGACLRSGKTAPNERLQKEIADELRARVADEFIKRREESEWFVEGDFDSYVSQMRKPHVWGGEPELFMASHVLRMPITVYMRDDDAGGLISIAEYGQEYGKEDPIRVLYHGSGHYDALQIPGRKGGKSKL